MDMMCCQRILMLEASRRPVFMASIVPQNCGHSIVWHAVLNHVA